MEWKVEFYTDEKGAKPVKEWMLGLEASARSALMRNVDLLERMGLGIREPYVKYLEEKLYEVRAKDRSGIYRVIYFAHTGKRFVLLHGFVKKTQKTPRKEIEIAKQRMREMMK
ncbi:type II toxin-antitoxin system RelE/ParE family toxin [Sulfurimonas sp. HSL-3221]|uniref:type II toxin-antitoxin system RelE/ParE family toxin n=1 Tax=Thiomicrolovo TaxID=3451667 RepID=UPI001E4487F2|nr:type II toxin-antitoxin system RelE/ParE family toxin [Sulfurimonas sp. HSL-3221]UFS63636.1 type II toxin-antitoxin system RelE/ParE family toxin [Sulfurimonas sp. HSL-3221]